MIILSAIFFLIFCIGPMVYAAWSIYHGYNLLLKAGDDTVKFTAAQRWLAKWCLSYRDLLFFGYGAMLVLGLQWIISRGGF